MKLTYNYIQKPADGAEEKEEIQEEEEEVIRSPSLPNPNIWGPRCCYPQGRAHNQASWNGYPQWRHEFEDYYVDLSARVPSG